MPQAEIGIIGGSGLYQMPGLTEVHELKQETPFGDPSDAYILGALAGRKVAFLARHGRGHRILPSELNFRANIYGFKQLGVERIVSVSAVGSLKDEHRPMDFVIPDQFFDRTRHRVDTFFGDGVVAHIGFGDPICPELGKTVVSSAQESGRECEARRNVCVHGRTAVFDQGGIERVSQLGDGRNRNDEFAGSEAGARSGDLLCDDCDGHGLRLLASASRFGDGRSDYRCAE